MIKVALLRQQRPPVCSETATRKVLGLPYRVPGGDLFTAVHVGCRSAGHHSECRFYKLQHDIPDTSDAIERESERNGANRTFASRVSHPRTKYGAEDGDDELRRNSWEEHISRHGASRCECYASWDISHLRSQRGDTFGRRLGGNSMKMVKTCMSSRGLTFNI